MKISFCSIGFQRQKWGASLQVEQPISQVLPVLAAAGCDGVEIWEPHLRLLSERELAELRRQLQELNLAVAAISPYFNFTTSEQTAAESMALAERVLGQARQLGARQIRVFTGKTSSQDATAEQWARTTRCLRQLADASAADGIGWVAEIHRWNLMDTVASTERLVAEVGRSNFGIIYHPNDLFPDYRQAIDQLAGAIHHVHAHNARDGKPCGLAEGRLDYRQILQGLRAIDYQGYLSIEWFGEQPAQTAQRETAYLRGLLAESATRISSST